MNMHRPILATRSSTILDGVGVQWRLHFFIQASLLGFFLLSQHWILTSFDEQGMSDVKNQAREISDGLINGLNLLMITGQISDPKNRELLLKKMSDSKNVKELKIVRAAQVNAQFGSGMPGENDMDSAISEVMISGKASFLRTTDIDGQPIMRALIPFIASENFRGTNCLSCHKVRPGSVNGVADIRMDLSAHEHQIVIVKNWLWSGMLFFQISLSALIALFVNVLLKRHISKPIQQFQRAIADIQESGDLSQRIALEGEYPDVDKMAHTFNEFINYLALATEKIGLLAKVAERSGESILITDADHNIVFVNSAFTHITGYSEQEVLGKNPRLLKPVTHDVQHYQEMWDELIRCDSWQGEVFNRKKNGEVYPEWQSICAVRNDKGIVTNYVSIAIDISKRREAENQISKMANFDALTGLANRNLLNDRLTQEIAHAHRHQSNLAVMYLDLDNFKDINDGYGHAVGDALLTMVANRLRCSVREGDTVARQGGDEFILLLPDVGGRDAAMQVAENMLHAVASPYVIEKQELFISVSIGIAIYPDDGTDMDMLFKNADSAMYYAKNEGRNCYRSFTPEMNETALRRVSLQNKLHHALERQELELHYQPQLNLISGKITGVEALIRWRDALESWISPSEFIPIAEDSGLIGSIGEWVIKTACADAMRWHGQGHTLQVSVNVSGRQFKEASFDTVVESALNAAGLAPHYLELEMTEGVLIQHNASLSKMLDKLKNIGIKLALDDFGTGYSSLSYIKQFPIDRIKIDQSFVRDVLNDVEDAAIVKAIVYIAHGLHIEVIAEGVETTGQLNFLNAHHCKDIQGYLVSRPIPGNQIDRFLETFNTSPPNLLQTDHNTTAMA